MKSFNLQLPDPNLIMLILIILLLISITLSSIQAQSYYTSYQTYQYNEIYFRDADSFTDASGTWSISSDTIFHERALETHYSVVKYTAIAKDRTKHYIYENNYGYLESIWFENNDTSTVVGRAIVFPESNDVVVDIGTLIYYNKNIEL